MDSPYRLYSKCVPLDIYCKDFLRFCPESMSDKRGKMYPKWICDKEPILLECNPDFSMRTIGYYFKNESDMLLFKIKHSTDDLTTTLNYTKVCFYQECCGNTNKHE